MPPCPASDPTPAAAKQQPIHPLLSVLAMWAYAVQASLQYPDASRPSEIDDVIKLIDDQEGGELYAMDYLEHSSGDAQALSRIKSSWDRPSSTDDSLRALIYIHRLMALWAVAMMICLATRREGAMPNMPENVCRMIVPWTGRKMKPAFTVEELIMMAILLQGPSTCEDIVVWILKVFYFYCIFAMCTASTVSISLPLCTTNNNIY